MSRVLAAVLALACACGHNAPSPVRTVAKPRLVVLVVIDQWPAWVFAQQEQLFTGGIGRLLREGAVVPAAELPYANPFTAVGHAAISTGTTPRVHGIVGNYWHRRDESRDRSAEYDPNALPFAVGPKLGNDEINADDGVSGRALRVEGVADVLRSATGGTAKSVSVAFKARAACLVAGKRPDLAIWYESAAGGMTTGAAYVPALPAWLGELATRFPVSGYFTSTWEPGDPALLARATSMSDAAPGESSHHGLDGAFPHSLTESDRPERMIQQTPFADEIVARTAITALDAMQLGRDDVPDLLAISFSAHDYAGHNWGPDSWEVLDLTLRLDRTLGELFEKLDTQLGKDGWAVVMTSDHGATPIVERSRVPGVRRIPMLEIEDAARKVLEAHLPDAGPWVAHIAAGNLYLTPHLAGLAAEVRGAVLDAVTKAVAAVPGIAAAGRTDALPAECIKVRDLARAICSANVPGEGGDLYVYPDAGYVISDQKFGTGHDAPFDDNRRVPILVKAPGLSPQRGTGSLLQVAPTVAALLGIPPPPAARESPLFGIRRR